MAIQNSVLIDLDGGLLNFTVLLFIYFYICNKKFMILLISLFFIFWSKLTAIPVLFSSLILLTLITKNFKKTYQIFKLFFLAGMSFLLTFFIYTSVFGLNWNYLFTHNSFLETLLVFLKSPFENLAKSLWGFKLFFYFATPFLLFLFFILSFFIIKSALKFKLRYLRGNQVIILLWLYSIFTILLFLVASMTGWNFAKYHITILPMVIILVIYFTPKKIINFKRVYPILIPTVLLLLGYFIYFLGDPLMPEIEGRFKTSSIFEVVQLVFVRMFSYAIIPLLLCFGLFKKIPQNRVWFTLLFLVIFTSFYLDFVQINADYSTHNLYGDKGLKEVIDFMKDKNSSEILGYPHLCYYLDYYQCYEITSLYYNPPELKKILNENKINWIVLYQKDIILIGNETLKDFKIEKEIGSYKILRRI